jgi:acetoin utilization protein AcuC
MSGTQAAPRKTSSPLSIAGVNRLPQAEKEAIYAAIVPTALRERFSIPPDLRAPSGESLAEMRCAEGTTDVVLDLRHAPGAEDPLLYAHVTDTVSGQIHVLLFVVNDPESPRFDVDRMPDGRPTRFGILARNLEAERQAMEFGLAPGQVRRGLRLLEAAITAFEGFVARLGHELYFVEPLFYHNAVLFERYGFSYQRGRRLMEGIHSGFQPGGGLLGQLDGSTPFRRLPAAESIRGRSWAIHDGILGYPFSQVTMFKRVGVAAGVTTYPDGPW